MHGGNHPSFASIFEKNLSLFIFGGCAGHYNRDSYSKSMDFTEIDGFLMKFQILTSRKIWKIMRKNNFHKKICKKDFFFMSISWAEIHRLPHSFGLWGCWGLTNIVHFDKIRGFSRFQVTFQRMSTGKCSPLKSRGENVKQLQLLDNRFAALKTARKLFAKVIQCISNVIAVSDFHFFWFLMIFWWF